MNNNYNLNNTIIYYYLDYLTGDEHVILYSVRFTKLRKHT